MIQPRHSIRDLFLLTISSAVLFILLLFYAILYSVIHKSYISTAEQTAHVIIQESASQINNFFQELEYMAHCLTQSRFVYEKDYVMMADIFLAMARTRSAYISSLYFGSTDGVFLQRGWSSSNFITNQGWAYRRLPWNPGAVPLLPPAYDPRTRPWYQAAVRAGRFIITDPYPYITKDQSETNIGLTAAIPVYRSDGSLTGVLGIDCSYRILAGWMETLDLPQGGKIALLDNQGSVLYWPFTNTSPAPVIKDLFSGSLSILSNTSGTFRFPLQDRSMLVSFQHIPEAGLIITAWFDIRQLMAPGLRAMLLTLSMTLAMLLLLIMVLRLQIGRLTSPLEELRNAMDQFREKKIIQPASLPLHFENNEVGHLSQAFNEMALAISRHEEDILHQLYFDRLTGLPNRRKLLQDIKKASNPVFILINIDAFKEINDFYGPAIGDYVLQEASRRFADMKKPHAVLYKFPSDEFAILLDASLSAAEIHEMVLFLCHEINRYPVMFQGYEILLQVTTGAAYGVRDEEAIDLISRADMALKKAKKTGQHFLLYQESMELRKEFENNLIMAAKLRQALNEDRIIPYYQPIMNNSTGRIEKYECLVRMRDESGSIIPPNAFLTIARKSRLYLPITRIMLEKSFQRFKDTDYEFSINLSLDDVLSTINREFILESLWKNPEVSPRVVFEFLESDNIENYEDVRKFIKELRNYHARIAIDDFGTGYSNFEHILQLRPDYIKLDASLIRNIHHDEGSQVIVETLSQFARRLSLYTIAEFVHSQEVLDTEKQLQVDFSQGYFIGEPREDLLS